MSGKRRKKRIPSSLKRKIETPAFQTPAGSEGLPAPKATYDAATTSKKRRTASPIMRSEDAELTVSQRRQLNASARDQRRNISIASWALRKHIDFVSSFDLQVRTDDKALNEEIENIMKWWSTANNCDIAGRHNLKRFIKIGEACRTIDGDVGFLRLNSGHMQAIESDRIRTPNRLTSDKEITDLSEYVHGVKCNPAGRAISYAIHNRKGNGFEYLNDVKASNMFLHAYYMRFDQFRGISPMASAINTLQDLHESFDYNLIKAKMHALFGLAITSEDTASGFPEVDAEDGEEADENTEKYDVKLDGRPMKLELDRGDDVKVIESHTPSGEFQSYSELMIRLALLALDIPYIFFNSKGSSYSAGRMDVLLYLKSAKSKREDNQELLNKITAWKLGQFIGSGILKLPKTMSYSDIKWEWLPNGLPWIDPLKEAKANGEAISLKLKSRRTICMEQGYDWEEEHRQIQREEELIGEAAEYKSNISDEDLKDE